MLQQILKAYRKDQLQFWASVTSLIAVYLISEKVLVIGWSLNLWGDILWIWWGVKNNAVWLIGLQSVFIIIAINGVYNA